MEILSELFGAAFHYFFGALAGVLWPAKSPLWARWQKYGATLGVISILAFGVAVTFARMKSESAIVWPAAVVGLVSLVGYAIIGNVCRKFHEGK